MAAHILAVACLAAAVLTGSLQGDQLIKPSPTPNRKEPSMITRSRAATGGQAPVPAPVNGIDRVSAIQVVQLAYLAMRNLAPAKKGVLIAAITTLIVAAGVLYGMGETPTATVLLVGVLAVFPAAGIVGIWINTHPAKGWVRDMFSTTGTQLIRQDGDRWNLTDHYAWVRGRGAARPFRRQAFAELARQADLLQVVITMDTRVQTLRDYYLEDMPGLQFDRTSTNEAGETVWHLIRHPQPPIQEER